MTSGTTFAGATDLRGNWQRFFGKMGSAGCDHGGAVLAHRWEEVRLAVVDNWKSALKLDFDAIDVDSSPRGFALDLFPSTTTRSRPFAAIYCSCHSIIAVELRRGEMSAILSPQFAPPLNAWASEQHPLISEEAWTHSPISRSALVYSSQQTSEIGMSMHASAPSSLETPLTRSNLAPKSALQPPATWI